MGFCTRNNDGASGKAESANTINNKAWRGIQDRALKHNSALKNPVSDESVKRNIQGRDNYKNRKSC